MVVGRGPRHGLAAQTALRWYPFLSPAAALRSGPASARAPPARAIMLLPGVRSAGGKK